MAQADVTAQALATSQAHVEAQAFFSYVWIEHESQTAPCTIVAYQTQRVIALKHKPYPSIYFKHA